MAQRKLCFADVGPDVPFVSIYCSGRPAAGGVPNHQDAPWRIATFYPWAELPEWPDGTPRWAEVTHNYWTADRKVLTLDTAPTRVSLVGDRVVSIAEWQADPSVFDTDSRSAYKLGCRKCGLRRVVRDSTFEAALLQILTLEIREVSLLGLAAILGKA